MGDAGQLDLLHAVDAQSLGRRQHRRRGIASGIVPVHQGFADRIDCYRIGTAANRVEVLDEVVRVGAEWAIALARVERVHHEPLGIRRPRQIDDLLIDVVAMAARHPVVIG